MATTSTTSRVSRSASTFIPSVGIEPSSPLRFGVSKVSKSVEITRSTSRPDCFSRLPIPPARSTPDVYMQLQKLNHPVNFFRTKFGLGLRTTVYGPER